MNIAIFTNNYLPNPYGVSTSIETFRRDFEKMGHTVYIFAPNWPGYTDKNPNVFRYPSLDIEVKFRFPLAVPYSWRIEKILKKLDIDIIHAQHPNLLGTAAMKWARRRKIPLVFTWHTLYDHYAHFAGFIPESLAAKYMIGKAVRYANKADVVIVPTDSITKKLRDWGVKNEIIPVATGVVEDDFLGADRNIIRKKYGIEENDILLLLVSRLTSEKNVLFVAEAVKDLLKGHMEANDSSLIRPTGTLPCRQAGFSLREKGDRVKLLIVGGGYLASKIVKMAEEEGIADKIILAGEVSHDNVKDYYAAGDIFIYGSVSETQGMILTEAMHAGLPVVAVSATGTNSLVLNNGNGFLVGEDKKEFSEAVLKLINDANLRQQFSEVSRRIARTNFTSEICAKKMLEAYQKAIAKNTKY